MTGTFEVILESENAEKKEQLTVEHPLVEVIEHGVGNENYGPRLTQQLPTGLPGIVAEHKKMTTRKEHYVNGEDNAKVEDSLQGRKSNVLVQEPSTKNRIEQYLISTTGTSTPTRSSGGNRDNLHKVNREPL